MTYANVMATAAMFVALGGGAYAVTSLPKNSVGTKQLKKDAVTTPKLKDGAVTGPKVKLKTLGTVPYATNAKHAATATSAATASRLTPPSGFSGFPLTATWVDDSSARGTPYPVGFYKDREGFVHLRGAASLISGTDKTIGVLPAGARPPGQGDYDQFPAFTFSGVGRVKIHSDGTIELAAGDPTDVSLEGITFRAGN